MEHPTGKPPKKVIILGMGPSKSDFFEVLASAVETDLEYDEVWGINAVGNCLRVDLTFAMDDYMKYKGRDMYMTRLFEKGAGPIITSAPRAGCPTAVPFPMEEVLALPNVRMSTFNHTGSYIMAYAHLLGVKEAVLFGCDYVSDLRPYDSVQITNPARFMGGMGWWIGYCEAHGMQVVITPSSALLDSNKREEEQFYGYLVKPLVQVTYDKPPLISDDEEPQKEQANG